MYTTVTYRLASSDQVQILSQKRKADGDLNRRHSRKKLKVVPVLMIPSVDVVKRAYNRRTLQSRGACSPRTFYLEDGLSDVSTLTPLTSPPTSPALRPICHADDDALGDQFSLQCPNQDPTGLESLDAQTPRVNTSNSENPSLDNPVLPPDTNPTASSSTRSGIQDPPAHVRLSIRIPPLKRLANGPPGPILSSSSSGHPVDVEPYLVRLYDPSLLSYAFERRDIKRALDRGRTRLFTALNYNPWVPQHPGMPGLLIRGTAERPSSIGIDGARVAVFVGCGGSLYGYMGEYVLERATPLHASEFCALDIQVRSPSYSCHPYLTC